MPEASLIPLSLVAPGVSDERQQALAQLFGEALAGIDLSGLAMNDALTVDAKALPYKIRAAGAAHIIDVDLPEAVQRRILKNIWQLKILHGYDAGVKLGLSLLGMVAEITHWHQMQPMGVPNTHRITFYVGDQLFENAEVLLGEREIAAAKRMVDATKRWSQETSYVVGARLSRQPLQMAARGRALSVTRCNMSLRRGAPQMRATTFTSSNIFARSLTRLNINGAAHA